jgi:protein gp37
MPNLDLTGIHWLIAGGESQSGCRPAEKVWFRNLRDQCKSARVAFFLKQLGGHLSKRGGDEAVLDGRRWTQMPIHADPSNDVRSTPFSVTASDLRSSVR